jgi:hypothetical protein
VKKDGSPGSLFGWLVADGWCWFVLREEYCWLVAGGWFVVREKYCWLVAEFSLVAFFFPPSRVITSDRRGACIISSDIHYWHDTKKRSSCSSLNEADVSTANFYFFSSS